MAEFWEQQMMDRLLNLCFEYKKKNEETIPAEQIKDVIDYVKYLLAENKKKVIEDMEKGQ